MASRGIGARRKCDLLIEEGQVRVNGKVVRELGTLVDAQSDRIEVAGKALPPEAKPRYYVLNKPVGVISTLSDPEGRRTVREFLPPGTRLFPVGRLDADTSGLLVLTNDGDLAHHLMHPRFGVEKVYKVWVDHPPTEQQLGRLRNGIEFEPGVVSAPARARSLEAERGQGLIELAIHEGRYRQVRRMCEAIGLNVTGLHRWAYGPIKLGPVERGMWRELSQDEVERLRASSAKPTARGSRRGEFFSARRGLVSSQRPSESGRGPRRAPSPPRVRSERPGTAAPRGRFNREAPTGSVARRERPPGAVAHRDRPASTRPRPERPTGTRPRPERAGSGRTERDRPASTDPRSVRAARVKAERERPTSRDPRRERASRNENPFAGPARREPRDFGSPARRMERALDRKSAKPSEPPAPRRGSAGRGDRDSVQRYSRSESNRNIRGPQARTERHFPGDARGERDSRPPRATGGGRSGRPPARAARPASGPGTGRPASTSRSPSRGAPRGTSRSQSSSRGQVGQKPRSSVRKGGSTRPGRPSRMPGSR